MDSRNWYRGVGVTVCVAGLALAGCTGGESATDRSDSATPDAPAGPLEEFFGFDPTNLEGDGEPTEADRQLHYHAEERVQECMAEHGFEYYPQQYWADGAATPEEAEPWRLQREDPEAFASNYGYGISTIDQPAHDERPTEPAAERNQQYQQSLSPAAREQYELALWGDLDAAPEEAVGGPEEGLAVVSAGGCRAEATDEVYGIEERLAEAEQFQGLQGDLAVLEQRIADDARLQAAKRAWSGCMAGAGYPDLHGFGDGQVLVGERLADLHQADPDSTVAPPDELAELREFERGIAQADLSCRSEHEVDEIEREVRFELEEAFIEDHREELEAYRDWLNE